MLLFLVEHDKLGSVEYEQLDQGSQTNMQGAR